MNGIERLQFFGKPDKTPRAPSPRCACGRSLPKNSTECLECVEERSLEAKFRDIARKTGLPIEQVREVAYATAGKVHGPPRPKWEEKPKERPYRITKKTLTIAKHRNGKMYLVREMADDKVYVVGQFYPETDETPRCFQAAFVEIFREEAEMEVR